MTLNIMLTSRHAVYLTGDFRLTFPDGHSEDDLLAQKLVPVVKFEWCALVAFCGVAKTSTGIDVGDWISANALVDERKESVDAFINRLQTADQWLSRLGGDRRLTISVVGFRGRRPFVVVLSNFENLDGKTHPRIRPRLQVFRPKPKDIELRVFGVPNSISVDERRDLKKLLRKNQLEPLKKALGEANRRASKNSKGISPECVVGCLLPSGAGEIMPYGIDPSSEYVPRFVTREWESQGIVGLRLKTGSKGERLNPHWRGMTIKIQGKGKRALFNMMHAIGNVEEIVGGTKKPNTFVWQKIAGPDEPKTHTFKFHRNRR